MGEPPAAALVEFLDGIKLGVHVDVFMKLYRQFTYKELLMPKKIAI